MALRVRVVGIVQGVGFRPHVYRLAKSLGLKGYVKNLGGAEVEIWIEGDGAALEDFIRALREKTPKASEIEEMVIFPEEPRGYSDFTIEKSEAEKSRLSMIPPDFGVCSDCLREVLNPNSRWYRYPFHSCAWCGPRFTVVYRPPYDRGNTSWKDFPLCPECLKEYVDPSNLRRFHIQGISCPRCGPRLRLVDGRGEEVEGDPISTAAKLVDEQFIVAVKGVGGFHLAALATEDDVVAKLRARKRRKRKPLAVMALDIKTAEKIVEVSERAREVLESPARPIVILPRREEGYVSKLVAPNLKTLGVMLAYTPLHYLLLLETRDKFLVMTSGNESGEPIIRDNSEALSRLGHVADFFLIHDREIVNRVDDSVVRFTDGDLTIIRRARGYAPRWLNLPREVKRSGIATGAMLMNTAAVAAETYIIPTQHIGDVENLETLDFTREALEFLVDAYKLNLKEALVASDKHPGYPTRAFALELAEKWCADYLEVQHHVAHIAAGMLEHKLEESVGIAIDGVGYGDDGQVWGGEVIHLSSGSGYRRVGHLEYFPLPGGDRAAEYPARILLGALVETLGPEEGFRSFVEKGYHNFLPGGFSEAMAALSQTSKAPLASSTGRFLDAVAAALGVAHERSYEGEPAITLEEFSWGGELVPLPIEVEGGVVLVKEFLAELASGAYASFHPKDVARSAQQLLGRALATVAREEGARRVVVSGGAAVNSYIVKGIREVLGRDAVLLPRKLPPGDGGLSAGQLYYAFLEKLL
ncbi:MAG: carbamoyltransferase HypF [Thermofilum sp.]